MRLHLEGSNTMNAPLEKVYSLLTDPGFMAKSIPDAEDVRVLDGSTLEAKMKLRVAVVSSTIKTKMTISKVAPPTKAQLVAEGTGSGSSLKIASVFDLSGGSPTTMKWAADADIGGVMAGIGSALLKGFATKRVEEIFAGLTRAVEASA